MKEILKKFTVVSFYTVTFTLSGLLLILNIIFPQAERYGITFPQLAPGIVAVVFIWLMNGDIGLRNLKSKLTFAFTDIKWLIIAILLPAFVLSICFFILSYIKTKTLTPPKVDEMSMYLSCLIGIIIGSIGEEIGWRGFMLPKLQLKYSALASSILLGIFWGFWHLNFSFGVIGFFAYSLTVTELSIIFTWLCNKTNGRLMIPVALHTSFNFFTRILLYSEMGICLFFIEIIVFGILCIIIIKTSGIDSLSKKVDSSYLST